MPIEVRTARRYHGSAQRGPSTIASAPSPAATRISSPTLSTLVTSGHTTSVPARPAPRARATTSRNPTGAGTRPTATMPWCSAKPAARSITSFAHANTSVPAGTSARIRSALLATTSTLSSVMPAATARSTTMRPSARNRAPPSSARRLRSRMCR